MPPSPHTLQEERPTGPATADGEHSPALVVLTAFVLTFLAARCVVYLIMTGAIPDLFLFVGGTHVHHLNYGIFLLSATGAYVIFKRPEGRPRRVAAAIYGTGLALTFDEFGMWLHLGGSYWQRASFDAVVVVLSVLGLIAAAPAMRKFRRRHWTFAAVVAIAMLVFAVLVVRTLRFAENALVPRLERLDDGGRTGPGATSP